MNSARRHFRIFPGLLRQVIHIVCGWILRTTALYIVVIRVALGVTRYASGAGSRTATRDHISRGV